MSQHHFSPEISFESDHSGGTGRLTKVLIWLSVITIVELALGLWIYNMHKSADASHGLILFLKGAILILSLLKAFYIVSVFMHLGDEIRNFVMTIIVPLLLFVWFIIAFLMDGAHWLNMRNTDAGSRQYVPKTEQHAAPATNPGDKK